jgi:hypothetical protein
VLESTVARVFGRYRIRPSTIGSGPTTRQVEVGCPKCREHSSSRRGASLGEGERGSQAHGGVVNESAWADVRRLPRDHGRATHWGHRFAVGKVNLLQKLTCAAAEFLDRSGHPGRPLRAPLRPHGRVILQNQRAGKKCPAKTPMTRVARDIMSRPCSAAAITAMTAQAASTAIATDRSGSGSRSNQSVRGSGSSPCACPSGG